MLCLAKKSILFVTTLIALSITLYSQEQRSLQDWKIYFDTLKQIQDPIEGIWTVSNTVSLRYIYSGREESRENINVAKAAIFKEGDLFKVIFIESDEPNGLIIEKTAFSDKYLTTIFFSATNTSVGAEVDLIDNSLLNFEYTIPFQEAKHKFGWRFRKGYVYSYKQKWLKYYPIINNENANPNFLSSGSGIGISRNGIIATNYHVVKNSKLITVSGINGDFEFKYLGKVLYEDRLNDLALIKITDNRFLEIDSIPFSIETKLSSVGEEVFVMGFPLRSTMGDELKLTTGVISSKTGYQGDITTYQISAAAQPGNSGGPVFNSEGNLVGILTAKHIGAENANYAVKTNYLLNLIDLLDQPFDKSTKKNLKNLSLADKVEVLRDFVFIVEVQH